MSQFWRMLEHDWLMLCFIECFLWLFVECSIYSGECSFFVECSVFRGYVLHCWRSFCWMFWLCLMFQFWGRLVHVWRCLFCECSFLEYSWNVLFVCGMFHFMFKCSICCWYAFFVLFVSFCWMFWFLLNVPAVADVGTWLSNALFCWMFFWWLL